MHRAFVANAAFILHFFLGTTKGSPFAQSSIIGLVFVISGAMHVVGLKVVLPTCKVGSMFWYYCLHGLGIIIEDTVSRMVGKVIKSPEFRRLARVVGYIWTFLYISWIIPTKYPITLCMWD